MLKQTKMNFLKDIDIIKRSFSKANSKSTVSSLFRNNNSLTILKSPNNSINSYDIPTAI